MFDRDERVIGLQRNDERETLRQWVQQIQAAWTDRRPEVEEQAQKVTEGISRDTYLELPAVTPF